MSRAPGWLTLFLLAIAVEISISGDFLPSMSEDIEELCSTAPLTVLGSGAVITSASLLFEGEKGNPDFLGEGPLDDVSILCHHSMGLPLLGASALFWGAGAIWDSESTEETGQMLTEGLVLTYGTAGILKLGTGRLRPRFRRCRG